MERTVDSLDQYDALLKRLSRKYAARPEIKMRNGQWQKCGNAILITRPNGDSLLVVIGGADSYISFYSAARDGIAYRGIGDSSTKGTFAFFVDGHWTEAQRHYAISPAMALDAARRFVQMADGLPAGILWLEEERN
jgi:hypothetical protein